MEHKNQSFIISLTKLLAVLNSSMWILNKIIPESFYNLIKKAIDRVVMVVDSYPLQSVTFVLSFIIITHAIALKRKPPESWK